MDRNADHKNLLHNFHHAQSFRAKGPWKRNHLLTLELIQISEVNGEAPADCNGVWIRPFKGLPSEQGGDYVLHCIVTTCIVRAHAILVLYTEDFSL